MMQFEVFPFLNTILKILFKFNCRKISMPGVETPPVGSGQPCDHSRDLRDVLVSARSRVQVTPHRLIVVLFIREYCQYKQSLPVSPLDRSATSLLMLNLIQSPDLDLSTTASKYEVLILNLL